MFTGIVTEVGRVTEAAVKGGGLRLRIEAPGSAPELEIGSSIAVNGVCLTAVEVDGEAFSAHAMDETLARSSLGGLHQGDRVNLELPARLIDRLGGHLVQGHVDGVAQIDEVKDDEGSRRVWMTADTSLLRYMVEKGSVALDGVSLTIVDVEPSRFQVALIPHTLEATNLGEAEPGRRINVEVDVIAKYVERLAAPSGRDEERM